MIALRNRVWLIACSGARRVRDRWEGYWFSEGGRYSLAIIRVGVALAVWLSLNKIERTWPLNAPGGGADSPASYHAVGLWQLAGSHVPSLGLVSALWPIARLATVAMALGLGGRVASVTSWVAGCSLAALYYSGFPAWSHEYNVVFTVQLAIAFAPTTDALSLDVVARKLLGRPPRTARNCQWAVRLAQLACALMFASAALHKLTSGGSLSLHWALSDNLRNQLLVHFDAAGLPRTPVANWLLDDVWRYRGAAVGNLVAQTLPLVACFLVHRPLLRAACGACFVLETLGLGYVMDLWDLHWLPPPVLFLHRESFPPPPARRPPPVEPRAPHPLPGFPPAATLPIGRGNVPICERYWHAPFPP